MPIGSEGVVSRAQPQPFADQFSVPPRFSKYREGYVQNAVQGYNALADEGSYFVTTSGTVSTAIAFGAAANTAFTDTTGIGLVIQNLDAVGGANSKRLYLDYIKLIYAVVGAGITTTGQHFWGSIDPVLTRYTSGGTTLSPVNPNMDSSNKTIAKAVFGALTTVALSGNGRLVFRSVAKGITPVANDELTIVFGGVEKARAASSLSATIPSMWTINAPPVVLGPGHTFALGSYAASQSGATTFEFELGWYER